LILYAHNNKLIHIIKSDLDLKRKSFFKIATYGEIRNFFVLYVRNGRLIYIVKSNLDLNRKSMSKIRICLKLKIFF